MAKDFTLNTNLAPQVDRVRPVAQSAFIEKLDLMAGRINPPGMSPAFAVVPTDETQGNFIQRPHFRAGGAATRQDTTTTASVDSVSKDMGYGLDPILEIIKGPEAWGKAQARKGTAGDFAQWFLDFALDAGQAVPAFLQKRFCEAGSAVAQLDADHFLDRSGTSITYEDVMDAVNSWGDNSDRARSLLISTRQKKALQKFIVLGPTDPAAIAPLLNPLSQEYNATGRIETLAGLRVLTYDGVYQDGSGNDYALILATDTVGKPGCGVSYLAKLLRDMWNTVIGGLLDMEMSCVASNDFNTLVYTVLAEARASVWFDKARFDSTKVNPTAAYLADPANWTADYVSAKELTVTCIASEGDAL